MYLYGASGHAKVIAETLHENGIEIEGVFDDNISIESFVDLPFCGVLDRIQDHQEFIISIGSNICRKKIARKLFPRWGKAISKYANISASVHIGEGTVIMKGVSINVDVTVGRHVILNTNCSIDHDCIISDFVHVSPNAALAGNVFVGEGSHIGTGACVIPGVKIGKWAIIGAGSVIIKDIPDYAVVVGNPGKVIKYNIVEL